MKKIIAFFCLLSALAGISLAAPAPVMAAGGCPSNDTGFLGLPTWYRGLTNADCTLRQPVKDSDGSDLRNYIWRIILNVIDIIARLIGWIATGFVLYGGFQYITSAGNSDGIKKAKTTITNALIGLILALTAAVIVNFIVGIWK